MKIAFTTIGDVHNPHSSSGTPYNLYQNLEKTIPVSGALNRWQYIINLIRCFHPNRSHWRERSYKNKYVYQEMTKNVVRQLSAISDVDYILQFQTLFRPCENLDRCQIPFGIYTDYTSSLADREYPDWLPFHQPKLKHWWLEKERELYQSARHIFTFTETVRQSVINDFAIKSDKVFTVGAGVGWQSIEDAKSVEKVSNFLFVGKDFQRKGVQYLLDAFSVLHKDYPDIELKVIGVNIPSAIPGVINIPFIENRKVLRQYFLQSNVFVMPSLAEPFGYTFLEAMACGLPCIGTNNGGVADIIQDKKSGFLIDPRSSQQIKDKMQYFIQHPSLVKNYGDLGLKILKQRFQWNIVAQKITSIILQNNI